ncbi:MAG: hypothetical protein EXS46_02955 [Candidatus Taylorbacteria bacterium]|nr:hypothetical protein [Candidatus Taylorbacteria bacterium]
MQVETKCWSCGKKFVKHVEELSNRDSFQDTCYNCALESLTKGQPPEEGDFNTAGIVSGEMSDDECGLLQEDLRSVDWAACQTDPEDDLDDR